LRIHPEKTMRRIHLIAAIGALALTAACSRSDGHSADNTGASIAQNPDVRRAEAEIGKAGHTAAKDLRKLGAEAKVETHKLADDTRGATHDDHNRSNDKSS
jgi:hypothetical protein